MGDTYRYDPTHDKCSDHEKTAQWFKDVFGCREVGRRSVRNIPIISLDAGGTMVNFSPRVGNEDVEDRRPGPAGACTTSASRCRT